MDLSSYGKYEGERTKTLMISGIIQNVSDDALTNHFSKYGKVSRLHRNKESNKKYARWAFVTFKDFESVDKTIAEGTHMINGHHLDIRKAMDFKSDSSKAIHHAIKNQKVMKTTQTSLQPVTAKQSDVADVSKLLVKNLKATTTVSTLEKYFSKFGTVYDTYIPTHYGTNKSKGFGYIVMPNKDVNFKFRGHIIDGNPCSISEDNPHHLHFQTATLLVSAGLQTMEKLSEQDLEKFFSRFGKIVSVRKPADPSTRTASHYAFVEYASKAPVGKAIGKMVLSY